MRITNTNNQWRSRVGDEEVGWKLYFSSTLNKTELYQNHYEQVVGELTDRGHIWTKRRSENRELKPKVSRSSVWIQGNVVTQGSTFNT